MRCGVVAAMMVAGFWAGSVWAEEFAVTRSVTYPSLTNALRGEMFMTVASNGMVAFQEGRWSYACAGKSLPELERVLMQAQVFDQSAREGRAQSFSADAGEVEGQMFRYHWKHGQVGYLTPGFLPMNLVPVWRQLMGLYAEAQKEVDEAKEKAGGPR